MAVVNPEGAAEGHREPVALLEVDGLHSRFWTPSGAVHAVRGVSFAIHAGETVGLVGESGCGKSATALSLLRLLPEGQGDVISGKVLFEGQDLMRLGERRLREVRGNQVGFIFQDASTALNPALSVGAHLAEALRSHGNRSREVVRHRSVELLEQVGIPEPTRVLHAYPHQLSGGMKQRIMIAAALSCEPALLIADEPTTALDVTIQAQILELIASLSERLGVAVILITHDMGVVAGYTDRTMVMYAGRIIEEAPTRELFRTPRHPYTAALLNAVPRLDARVGRLEAIGGAPPDLGTPPKGCAFAPRCRFVEDRCRDDDPPTEPVSAVHRVACLVRPELS